MKNKFCILILIVALSLLTACSKSSYEKKGDKHTSTDYEKSKEFYLKSLEKESNPDTFIKLANLHEDNYNYDQEFYTLYRGKDEFQDSDDLQIRLGQSLAFKGSGGSSVTELKGVLERGYNEKALKELFSVFSQYYMEPSDSYYKKYQSEITDIDTKILAYKTLRSDGSLKDQIEYDLLNSDKLEAYEVLAEEFLNRHDFDKLESLISKLNSTNYGSGLARIYSKLLQMDEFDMKGIQSGYFIDKNRKDLAVFYADKYDSLNDFDPNCFITLFNIDTGEIIINKGIEGFPPDGLSLYAYEEKDSLDKLAASSIFGASASSPRGFDLFDFSKEDLKYTDDKLESDVEFKFLEGFKIQVESKSLKTKIIVDIPEVDYADYISDGQYYENGVPTPDSQVMVYNDDYYVKTKRDKHNIIGALMGFGGTYRFSADRLAFVEELYSTVDGKLKCVGLNIMDQDGMSYESRHEDGVKIITLTND